MQWIQSVLSREPTFLRVVLGALRERRPVVRLGNTYFVTGGRALLEVLGRSAEFVTSPVHGPKLRTKPSLLAMDATPDYLAQRSIVADVLQKQAQRADCILSDEARNAILAWGRPEAGHDLVALYSERVISRAAARFYGLEPRDLSDRYADLRQHGDDLLPLLMRRSASIVFLSHPAPAGIDPLVDRLGGALEEMIRAEICRARQRTTESCIGDLVRAELPLEDLPGQVAGLVLAEMVLAKAFVYAVHEVLSRESAREAVLECVGPDPQACPPGEVLEVLRCHALEALRFRPAFPALPRYCIREAVLGPGTPYETGIPAGASLVLSLITAAHDPEVVERPAVFSAARFAAGNPQRRAMLDLVFGAGVHNCVGRFKAQSALPLMLGALFRMPGFDRVRPGRLRHEAGSVRGYQIEIGG